MTVRVVLVDDQALVRAGLSGLLDNSADIAVVGEAANGAEAVHVVRSTKPDVVLMDVQMPVMDGIEATRLLVGDPALTGTRVIVLTTFELDDYIAEALRAGASGFLVKDIEPEDLRTAVRVVAAGEALLSPGATKRLIAQFVAHRQIPADQSRLAALTGREREVMALAAGGLSNEEIGKRLFMSPSTARTHVHRAMAKLGARDRAQLVFLAYETGLVRPGH
ncbi:response regulator transcription factor [Kibdelosporangium philippinense]|uniref:Response regulator transcription factor n=1 Tax=Kibdelosporangium philippinense TaxID=211113 RepID=A0ABS8ZEW3_9PSEU|nr:response regulator transcription factor [Kibdelosporangium philippinense]MCE7006331.1 response regulator transcription factor [Kibdelosporangium philippinense]